MPNDAAGSQEDFSVASAKKVTSTQTSKVAMQEHRGGDAEAVAMLLAMQAPDEASVAHTTGGRSHTASTTKERRSITASTTKERKVKKASSDVDEAVDRTIVVAKAERDEQGGSVSSLPPARSSKSNNFLPALYKMCNCNEHTKCITWTEDGCSFWVSNIEQVGVLASSCPLPCYTQALFPPPISASSFSVPLPPGAGRPPPPSTRPLARSLVGGAPTPPTCGVCTAQR
jgi:hypothetical protein